MTPADGAAPPPAPHLRPPDQSGIMGKNEIYCWENLVGPFLVHHLFWGVSQTPPPPSLSLSLSLSLTSDTSPPPPPHPPLNQPKLFLKLVPGAYHGHIRS